MSEPGIPVLTQGVEQASRGGKGSRGEWTRQGADGFGPLLKEPGHYQCIVTHGPSTSHRMPTVTHKNGILRS